MNNQDKNTLMQWGTFILIALSALFAIAASFGSIKFGIAQNDAIYWLAGIANIIGWGFIAYRIYKIKLPE